MPPFLLLLQILDLLAHLFDIEFQIERGICHLDCHCLGAQRIRFAVQFLHEEVEAAADRAASGQHAADFIDVGDEPISSATSMRSA